MAAALFSHAPPINVAYRATSAHGWLPELHEVPLLSEVFDAAQITSALIGKMPGEYVIKGYPGARWLMDVRNGTAFHSSCRRERSPSCAEPNRSALVGLIADQCRRWLSARRVHKRREADASDGVRRCSFEVLLVDERGSRARSVHVFVLHGKPLFVLDTAERAGPKLSLSRSTSMLLDVTGHPFPAGLSGERAG